MIYPDPINTAEQAMNLLAQEPEATVKGETVRIRRKTAGAGEVSDGTREYAIRLCDRHRWILVQAGWDDLAQIDQRSHFEQPERLAQLAMQAIPTPFRTELTPAGEQTVIPGCEADAPQTGTTQLSLF